MAIFYLFLNDKSTVSKYHISTLSSKLSKSLHFLRAAKNIVTTSALKSVYYSLLHSHFIHGIQVWSSTATSNFKCLYIKQKTGIRHINCAKYTAIRTQSRSLKYLACCHCRNLWNSLSYSSFIILSSRVTSVLCQHLDKK